MSTSFEFGFTESDKGMRSTMSTVSAPSPLLLPGSLASWRAKRVRRYVEANLAQRLDTDILAGIVYVSRSHFCRAFKLTFGVTVHRYVMLKRVERAQRLMLTTSATLREIAMTCGMHDHPHLTRLFRQVVEETPAAWRRARSEPGTDSRRA